MKKREELCPDKFLKNTNKKVLDIFHKHLNPKDKERKLFGEIFTPISLVCEMLDKLPKKVWKNKDLKWLDPANGMGNFPVIVYYKLMDSLKDKIKTEKARSKHIIENMLYMNELNPTNVKMSKKIFKMIDSTAKPNIQKSDFLHNFKTFSDGTNKFDIIIGNPPYNSGGIKAITTKKVKRDQTKCKTIWPSFVKESFKLLKDSKSYLLFLHPASWISLKSTNGKLITSKQIVYLRYYSCTKAGSLFNKPLGGGTIPLTYCLIKNVETKEDTIIYDNCYKKDVMFNIYKNNFVPTESVDMLRKIYKCTQKYGSLKNKYMSTNDAKNIVNIYKKSHPYPIVNIVRKEIIVRYSKQNNDKNTEKKLILPNSSMGYPLYDKEGILYPASQHHFILYSNNNEKQLKQLQSYFFTSLIFYIITISKTAQKFLDNKLFDILPDITKMTGKTNITDDLLIQLFGLTKKDLICLEKYKQRGEGKLPAEKISQFKKFNIKQILTNAKINTIKKMKEQSPRKKSTRKREIQKYKSSKTRKKNTRKRRKTRRRSRKGFLQRLFN